MPSRRRLLTLVTKPGAFARYRYREELFPTLTFRRTYDALKVRTERAVTASCRCFSGVTAAAASCVGPVT